MVRFHASSTGGHRVQFLVVELRTCMPRGVNKKKQETKAIGVAMLMLNKVQSKAYYQLLRRLFHNDTEINVYSYNNEASKYIKQELIEMKGETEQSPY